MVGNPPLRPSSLAFGEGRPRPLSRGAWTAIGLSVLAHLGLFAYLYTQHAAIAPPVDEVGRPPIEITPYTPPPEVRPHIPTPPPPPFSLHRPTPQPTVTPPQVLDFPILPPTTSVIPQVLCEVLPA